MKLFSHSAALGFYLFFAAANQATAIDLWYDFEGDSGTTATDKLTSDGAQNGTAVNAVTLNAPVDNALTPGWGSQAAFFDNPPPPVSGPYSTFEIPDTAFSANYSATIAGWVNYDAATGGGRRFRILSSFSGGGTPNNVLLLDAGSTSGSSRIRGILGSNVTFNGPNLTAALTPGYHYYAMTVDGSVSGNSAVKLYFDGSLVTTTNTGTLAAGYTNTVNLRLGEDVQNYPTSNTAVEQLVGNADDVLVMGRALSATDISNLYNAGVGAPVSSIITPSASERGVYYDFEGDAGNSITDKFTLDGVQNSTGVATAMVDANAAHAKLGSQSATFTDPRPSLTPEQIYNQITTTASGTLGPNFTLSAVVNPYGVGQSSGGVERLFSNYGGGSTAGSLIVDFNPATTTGIRVYLPNNTNTPTLSIAGPGKPDVAPGTKQTLTVTYETGATNDTLRVYLDGVQIGIKSDIPAGTIQSLGANPLRIGEDRIGGQGAFANENYNGTLDDVLILSRALTADQVALLHSSGAAALLATLPAGVAGDYNHNGVVDAADYVVWRKSNGQTGAGLAADGNNDGTVNAADYDFWRAHFGNTAGAGSGIAAAVPEPGIGALVLILAGLAGAFRGQRSR